jgi:beta-aspartyl-dipeptidase (metallo-type)
MDVARASAMAEAVKQLLECGQPLERVLPAFTTNPASLLRLSRKGHLTTGADADLVVLDDAGGVRDVMARGRWHVLEGRSMVRGTFERIERE